MSGKAAVFKLLVIAGIIFFASSQLYAQSVVLTETEVKEDNSAVKILYATNRSVVVECYDLAVPPQIIVDFMGDVYTKQPEVKMINMGVVKQMRFIKGTKVSPDLDESYYSVDFVIIDLKEPVRYDFDQGLTTSVLMISKPGQPLPEAKAEKEEKSAEVVRAPLAVVPTPAVEEKKVVVAQAPVLEEKEYEQANVAAKPAPVEKKTGTRVSTRQRKPAKTESQAPVENKKITSKMTSAIGSFFTFNKEKKRTPVQVKDQSEIKKAAPVVKREARVRKPRTEQAKSTGTPEKKKELKVRKKRERIERGSKTDNKNVVSARRAGGNPADQVESAKKKVADAQATVDKAQEQVDAAVEQIIVTQKDQDTSAERLKFSKAKEELAKDDYDKSLKNLQLSKGMANSVWVEYSNIKAQLSSYLANGVDAKLINDTQKLYDKKKDELENVIKAAEATKEESDAKLEEYNKLKKESEDLLIETQNPESKVSIAKRDYAEKENNLAAKQKELEIAKQELATANLALKQYEIEKADEEYKKSLGDIDSKLIKQMEEEQKKAAEAKRLADQARQQKLEQDRLSQQASLQKLEDEKHGQDQARLNDLELQKAKEAAQIAAVKALDEDHQKETVKSRRTSRRSESRPISRKVNMPEKKVVQPDNGPSNEVLESAVELRNAGLEMQRKGDYDSAVRYYQEALLKDPKYATVHNDLGILYEQKGLEEKAKMEYLTTLKIDPQYIKAHSNLALLYEKSGDYKKAYYHWKQRVNLGREDDPWTLKAKQKMQALENRK
jgi:tetratricopeptide (TPR) repeat protein